MVEKIRVRENLSLKCMDIWILPAKNIRMVCWYGILQYLLDKNLCVLRKNVNTRTIET